MARLDLINLDKLVINHTSKDVVCYNSEGHFIALFPTNELPLPDYESGKMYVVDNEEYQRVKNSGRPTKDLVRITSDRVNSEVGRGGVKFSYLEAYDGSGKTIKVTPCSLADYSRTDPKRTIHQLLNA